jgi:hypothetical protein
MVTRQPFVLTLVLVTVLMAATGCTWQPVNAVTGPTACSGPPAAIAFLGWTTATVPPGSVVITWDAVPGGVTSYIVELGTTRGAANIGVVEVSGAAISYTFNGLAPGDYFARARAKNACGLSAVSNEANPRVR